MKEQNDGKQMKTVWQFLPPTIEEKAFGKHPTQKPVALIERCLLASTLNEAIVLDPFMGSGTTGVAAFGLNRKFIGIEKEKNFFELAQKRLGSIPRKRQVA
jgi:site-specific DNA-methyltransferase (adenine-specific)